MAELPNRHAKASSEAIFPPISQALVDKLFTASGEDMMAALEAAEDFLSTKEEIHTGMHQIATAWRVPGREWVIDGMTIAYALMQSQAAECGISLATAYDAPAARQFFTDFPVRYDAGNYASQTRKLVERSDSQFVRGLNRYMDEKDSAFGFNINSAEKGAEHLGAYIMRDCVRDYYGVTAFRKVLRELLTVDHPYEKPLPEEPEAA